VDKAGRLVTTAEAELGGRFLSVVEKFRRGELTGCSRKALSQGGIVVTEDRPSSCGDCPLSDNYRARAAVTARLEHDGKVYGLLSASLPRPLSGHEEEQTLFQQVAGDIAFALYSMQLDHERKSVNGALREAKELSDSLIAAMQQGFTILDPNGVHITT
jgi:GAF domain-containing protein